MPVNIPAGFGLAAIHLRLHTDPEDMVTTLGVSDVGAGVLGQAHAERVRAAFRTHLLPLMSNQLKLISVVLRVRQGDGSDAIFTSLQPDQSPGGVANGSAAPNVALLLEKLTSRGGRRGVGRMFIPGVHENGHDAAGAIDGPQVSVYQGGATAFINALDDPGVAGPPAEAPVVPVLFHSNSTTTTRTKSGGTTTITVTEGAAGPAPTTITGLRVDPIVATQRRRLR